ncbi:2,5-diamino-6-(ribosylamino)-4(3H)-pyrimidinone 5'-phosphate reductase [Marasmius tenuissimus]|nr:2,5-diamino-6-(ribosylamino)-4(3H)-pyrimidinone 5'-phosphate reductase [Marasmius tenuissimus]
MSFEQQPPTFLTSLFNKYHDGTGLSSSRPHVTLTFAQSIDGKIAGVNGKQLILSGKESMIMTHWMRTMHDAILVGIGTALNDNPQLNTRHLPPKEPDPSKNGHDKPYSLPRPIILDSHLRLDPACKLLANYQNGLGRRPWVLCSEPGDIERQGWEQRRGALESAGARTLLVQSSHDGAGKDSLDISACLHVLHGQGVRSLMVEGGARVIKSFFAEEFSSSPGQGIIDKIIVTVAPTFVGHNGVGYGIDLEEDTRFLHASTGLFGRDTVFTLSRVNKLN